MALPDNRIRLSSTKIDFTTEYGNKGQDIDNYPPEGGQARYDHMRAVILGLLGQQSSYDEPINYRDGTPWFDLNTNQLKIYVNGSWTPVSDAVVLEEDGFGNKTTLQQWYDSLQNSITSLSPEITFSGSASSISVSIIPIPTGLRSQIYQDTRPFVYKNGLLLDPRNTDLDSKTNPTQIILNSDTLVQGDTFVAVLKRIPDSMFYQASVIV